MYSIRATSLEKFNTCPYKFMFDPPRVGNEEFFLFGTAFHKIMELSIRGLRDSEWVWMILNRRPIKKRDILWNWSQVCLDELTRLEYKPVIEELSVDYTYKDKLYLQWTFDFLFQDPNWDYVVCDWKTAGSKRPADKIDTILQYKIYSALLFHAHGYKVKRFEYFIIVKTSKPYLQKVIVDVPDDCFVSDVDEIIENFISASENNNRWPTPSDACWYCKLKSKCINYVQI